jgi:hypothetical protein
MQKILSLTLLLSLFGCAAGPELADYPRREIDRPFNLPKGVATWSTVGAYEIEEYRLSSGSNIVDRTWVAAIPLLWRQNLSERWNLIWAPIPIAVAYQIRSDEAATTGLIFHYGLRISEYGYSRAAIGAVYSHRQRLTNDFALELTPSFTPWFPLGEKAKWDFEGAAAFGPLWQATELFSVRAGINPKLRREDDVNVTIFGSGEVDIQTNSHWRVVLPVYAGFNWSMARQWDLAGDISYYRIGERDGQSTVLATYELRHYW